MRKLLNILFIVLSVSSAFSAMPYSPIESAKISSPFKDNVPFCIAMETLSSNELGKKLIERVNEYLCRSSKNLIIEESFETRFEPNDGKTLKILLIQVIFLLNQLFIVKVLERNYLKQREGIII